jgi:hypothetical protein
VRTGTDAIPLFQQVKKLGADRPDTLSTLDNLASAYRAARKLPEAIGLHEQVKEARGQGSHYTRGWTAILGS